MDDLQLVVLDTTGIQAYIFGSNRLRENVGASHLVHMATGGWLLATPDHFLPVGRHNIKDGQRQDTETIRDDTIEAELLYAGGGNTALLFQKREDVRAFGKALSTEFLQSAPGLNVVMVAESFNWETSLVDAMERAMQKLAEKKRQRAFDQPLLGLSVTAACQSTGLPANYNFYEQSRDSDERSWWTVSAEVYAKQRQNSDAKTRLAQELLNYPGISDADRTLLARFEFPDDFDDLGRTKGEESYIGVVHADGNSIGKRLAEIATAHRAHKGNDNHKYITQLRTFSDQANHAGLAALRAVIIEVARWYDAEDRWKSLPQKEGKPYLPIRPIVFGGDDATYVCDGRIALQTAQIFLDAFGKQSILGDQGIAGAGVAIVKTHYPFARAYHLAEALTKSAKAAYQRKEPALDWHLAQSGLFGKLEDIRAQEYYSPEQIDSDQRDSLLMRPLTLAPTTPNWRTWHNFTDLLATFQRNPETTVEQDTPAKGLTWSRTKLMELRSALRTAVEAEDRTAVELFTQRHQPLPVVPNADTESQSTGWQGRRAVYYDAIEMLGQQLFDQTAASKQATETGRAQAGGHQ